MNKKINNLKEAEYYANFNLIGEYIVKWRKAKPENESINEIYFCWQEIGFYVHDLITNQRLYNESLSEYRTDKIRAVTRARTADVKIAELEKEIELLKTKINVGI